MSNNSLIIRPSDLVDLPFPVQAQLAELPQQAQEEFIREFSRRKKEVPIAYIAHFTSLSEGYLDNWTLQILFWFSCMIGIGPIWWFINLFRMPGKVKSFNKKLSEKVLKHIHYKYQIAGKSGMAFGKGRIFQNPGKLLKKAELPQPRKWTPIDPDSITLESLKTGYMLDHQTETFEVVSDMQYDWDDFTSEKLFKINEMAGLDNFFLILKKEGNTLAVFKVMPVNIYALKEDLDREIKEFKRPSNIIQFQGNTYFREYSKTGRSFDLGAKNKMPQEVVAWKYYDESRKNVIRIEQHGEGEFKGFIGKSVSPHDFPSIMPQ